MFKHYFEQAQNIEWYPIISLLVFFFFFVGLLIWVIRMDMQYIIRMKELPFLDELTSNSDEKAETETIKSNAS